MVVLTEIKIISNPIFNMSNQLLLFSNTACKNDLQNTSGEAEASKTTSHVTTALNLDALQELQQDAPDAISNTTFFFSIVY